LWLLSSSSIGRSFHLKKTYAVSPLFKSIVAYPILNRANQTIDLRAIAYGFLIPGQSPSSIFTHELNGITLYNGKTMADLSGPRYLLRDPG
jgi:hypothetical protein